MTTTVGDIVYIVSTKDDGPGRALTLHGSVPEFDALPRALATLERHRLSHGRRVFVDVGANIGTTALPALIVHEFDRVVAIEPEPENVRVLTASAALNDVADRVDVVAAAASDEPGQAEFRRGRETRRGWRAGAGSLLRHGEASGARSVVLTTVDLELRARGVAPADVGLLWIDVQGHEGHVLEGAATVVAASAPAVFALRPRKLAKAGRLERLRELVQRHYTHAVDLRDPGAVIRTGSFDDLIARATTTDVLVFREPPG